MAQKVFDVVARANADLFQAFRSVANDDFLLRVSLNKIVQ